MAGAQFAHKGCHEFLRISITHDEQQERHPQGTSQKFHPDDPRKYFMAVKKVQEFQGGSLVDGDCCSCRAIMPNKFDGFMSEADRPNELRECYNPRINRHTARSLALSPQFRVSEQNIKPVRVMSLIKAADSGNDFTQRSLGFTNSLIPQNSRSFWLSLEYYL